MDIGVDGIFYINLKHRVERMKWIESELSRMKFPKEKIIRIDAVRDKECGHIGCCKSHIKAIDLAKQLGYKSYLVFEDDFKFTVGSDILHKRLKDISSEKWDVCMLAGLISEVHSKKDIYWRIKYATTTSGYIVRDHYYDTLKKCFTESLEIMEKELVKHKEKIKTITNIKDRWTATRRHPGAMLQYDVTAIDRYWKKYQETDNFIMFVPPLGEQNELFDRKYKGNDT